jgi:hypothetical protein
MLTPSQNTLFLNTAKKISDHLKANTLSYEADVISKWATHLIHHKDKDIRKLAKRVLLSYCHPNALRAVVISSCSADEWKFLITSFETSLENIQIRGT